MKYPRKWRERCKEKKDSKLVDSVCKKLDRDAADLKYFTISNITTTITTTTVPSPFYQGPFYMLPNSTASVSVFAGPGQVVHTYKDLSRRTKRRIRIESKNSKRNIKTYK